MYNKRGLAASRIISMVMLASISAVAILQLTGKINLLGDLSDTAPKPDGATKGAFTLYDGTIGVPYGDGVIFGVDEDPPEFYYLKGDSPSGITLSPDGVLSGIPTKAGTYSVKICAEWSDGEVQCSDYPLTIRPRSEPKLVAEPALSGRWEGTYKVHIIFDGVWTCTTDTTAPISICVTQQGQEVNGIITFPDGFKDTTISAEPGLQCPVEPHCRGESGDQCSDFVGQVYSNGIFNINSLTLDGWEYTFDPYFPKTNQGKKQASATISANSMTFNFDSEASSSTNAGSFTATKVSDDCNT
jgi:hypothetical protein